MPTPAKEIIFGLILFIINVNASAQVDYFSPENIYRFAEHLYEERDYLRAAGEFQRYLILRSRPIVPDEAVLYKIGLCYQKAKDFEKAISYFQRIVDNYPKNRYRDQAYYQIAYTYFKKKDYIESINYIQQNIQNLSSYTTRLQLNQLLGLNYLYQRRWKDAHALFTSMQSTKGYTQMDSTIQILDQIAIEGEHLPYKSEFWAGLLSAIIPGTGKMYAKRFYDGLYSFILVGTTAWQAYEGFHTSGTRSVKGWIYGTLSGIFYIGNIYGSIVAVKIYNEKMEGRLLRRIGLDIKMEL